MGLGTADPAIGDRYSVLLGGVGAALLGSALAWTTARSRLGSLGALRSGSRGN